ncbi:terminase [Pseudomonas sp. 1152_12]
MGKRHPNLPAWQWRNYPQNQQHPTNLGLQLIAVPLLIIGFLLIASGVFSLSLASFAVGMIGVLAGVALQRQGRKLEAQGSQRF